MPTHAIASKNTSHWILFCSVFAFVLVNLAMLRLPAYGDEVDTLKLAFQALDHGFIKTFFSSDVFFLDGHTPLWAICQAILLKACSGSLVALRLFSLAFACGTIVATFVLAEKIWSRDVALLSALFITWSPIFLRGATTLYPGMPSAFFCTLAYWFYAKGKMRPMTLAFLAAVLVLELNIIFIAPLLLHAWRNRRRDFFNILIFLSAPLLFLAAYYLFSKIFAGSAYNFSGRKYISVPGSGAFTHFIHQIDESFFASPTNLNPLPWLLNAVTLLVLAFSTQVEDHSWYKRGVLSAAALGLCLAGGFAPNMHSQNALLLLLVLLAEYKPKAREWILLAGFAAFFIGLETWGRNHLTVFLLLLLVIAPLRPKWRQIIVGIGCVFYFACDDNWFANDILLFLVFSLLAMRAKVLSKEILILPIPLLVGAMFFYEYVKARHYLVVYPEYCILLAVAITEWRARTQPWILTVAGVLLAGFFAVSLGWNSRVQCENPDFCVVLAESRRMAGIDRDMIHVLEEKYPDIPVYTQWPYNRYWSDKRFGYVRENHGNAVDILNHKLETLSLEKPALLVIPSQLSRGQKQEMLAVDVAGAEKIDGIHGAEVYLFPRAATILGRK